MSEKSAKHRSIARKVLHWVGRALLTIVIILVSLIIADGLHRKDCQSLKSHKGEVHEMFGERLTFIKTGQETNGEVLVIDVYFQPTPKTNPLKWQDVHVHFHQE